MFPALVVGIRERLRRGRPESVIVVTSAISSSLPVAVAVGDLVLDHPHVPCLVLVQCLAAPGCRDQRSRFLPVIREAIRTDR